MKLHLSLIVSAALLASCASQTPEETVEALVEKGCLPVSEMNTKTTPIAMTISAQKCIEEDRLREAGDVLGMAPVYGKYDTLRVVDKTAHQAVMVLMYSLGNSIQSLPEDQRTEFQSYMQDRGRICQIALDMGKPTYHPDYMINHGMNAFTGSPDEDGIVDDFDPEAAWDEVLTGYIKCPKEIYPGA